MPIILEATYSKKLGLPNYSSHSFTVSLSKELTEMGQVEAESAKLYAQLQQSVDRELSEAGYLPDATLYGMNGSANGTKRQKPGNGSEAGNGTGRTHGNGNGASTASSPAANGDNPWACTEKQRELILRIVRDNNLDKDEVEATSRQLFGVGIKECNKMQASQIIEDLLEKTGTKGNGRRRQWRRERQSA